MFTLVQGEVDLIRTRCGDGVPALTPEEFSRHGPDAHWLLHENGGLAARCSLWWSTAPSYSGHRLGVIGHYAARDARTGQRLLQHACAQLAAHGCNLAVGPMDGNTWRHYRLVTHRGGEPAFFLEPDNPDDWPGHFADAGFTPIASYRSSLNTDLAYIDPRVKSVADRLGGAAVTIRPIAMDRLEEELRRIHALSLVSFRANFLFSPITLPEFLDQYRSIRPYIHPELVLLAEQGSRLVGLLFALPDLAQAQRGERVDTLILKTLAVLPERAFAGLGSLLATRCHQTARQMGFTRVIHALMHEANGSRVMSERYGKTIRRYALFARPLP
jgi:GNAT superfamily N-acetyltransferase